MFPKKIVRSNLKQIRYLSQYMQNHAQFAAGEYTTAQGHAQMERQWTELKNALDELGPPKTVEQWKICWSDQKRKARTEGGAVNRARNTTGNNVPLPDISANAIIILDTIGQEMATGCGPAETPIGFSNDTAQCSIAAAAPQLVSPQPPSVPALEQTVAALSPLRPAVRRRVRKVQPPHRFINAQIELNVLMKELIKEVRRSNRLKEEQNALLM